MGLPILKAKIRSLLQTFNWTVERIRFNDGEEELTSLENGTSGASLGEELSEEGSKGVGYFVEENSRRILGWSFRDSQSHFALFTARALIHYPCRWRKDLKEKKVAEDSDEEAQEIMGKLVVEAKTE